MPKRTIRQKTTEKIEVKLRELVLGTPVRVDVEWNVVCPKDVSDRPDLLYLPRNRHIVD